MARLLFLFGSLLLLLLLLPSAQLAAADVLVGGLRPEPLDGSEVAAAAAFAVEIYNERSGSAYYFKPLRILKAQSQVVSGMKYYISVELVNTLCEKRSGVAMNHKDLQNCVLPSKDQQQKLICDFVVWSRLWLDDIRLTSETCKAVTS